MKTLYKTITLVAILALASCSKTNENFASNDVAIEVKVNEIKNSNQANYITVSGAVQGVNNATISTRMMGVVKNIPVKVGDFVRKGTLLLSIDASDISAQLSQAKANVVQAEANFENTKKNYERFKNLFDKKSATQKELDDISTQLKAAKSQLEMAKEAVKQVNAQLSYSDIKAPFDGVITAKNIKEGNLANPGMPLLMMEENKNFEVRGTVSEADISSISTSKTVKVSIPSIQKSLEGKIKELSSSSSNMGGQYQITVSIPKVEKMYSGMYAKLMIPSKASTSSTSIRIPKTALIYKGQLIGVYTLSASNTAILRWVQTGKDFGSDIEIISGLSQNEKYITEAKGKLFNGAKVTVNQ